MWIDVKKSFPFHLAFKSYTNSIIDKIHIVREILRNEKICKKYLYFVFLSVKNWYNSEATAPIKNKLKCTKYVEIQISILQTNIVISWDVLILKKYAKQWPIYNNFNFWNLITTKYLFFNTLKIKFYKKQEDN